MYEPELSATATDPDGSSALVYDWSADTGTLTADGASASLAHDDGPASVLVTVTVRDGGGGLGRETLRVAVENLAPRRTGAPCRMRTRRPACTRPW